jgi:hypothetical protein
MRGPQYPWTPRCCLRQPTSAMCCAWREVRVCVVRVCGAASLTNPACALAFATPAPGTTWQSFEDVVTLRAIVVARVYSRVEESQQQGLLVSCA